MFDFIEYLEIITESEFVFSNYTPLRPFSHEFAELGYDSVQTIKNLGSIKFILLYFYGILCLIALLSLLTKSMRARRVGKILNKYKKSLSLQQTILSFVL